MKSVRPLYRKLTVAAAAATLLVITAACGSSTDDGSGTSNDSDDETTEPAELETVTLGVVPSLSLGLLRVGEDQGFFADEGIELDITPVDSGPNVITGLVAGQYDLGFTAYAPPLVALGSGQDLRLVSPIDTHGEAGTNGGVFVRSDSGISTWSDLEGATLGTNAPRSLAVLWVQGAIAADGGDPSSLELVPLPFNQIAENVNSGSLDAGISLQPYLTHGLAQFDELEDLGDPAAEFLPPGTPSGGIFTSAETFEAKADLIERFQRAVDNTIVYANDNIEEVRAAGAELTGTSAEDAAEIPLDGLDATATAEDFGPLIDALLEFEWIETELDIETFLSGVN